MNICLNCDHETDYTLKCANCLKIGQLVDLEKYQNKIKIVMSDPRFIGSENEAIKIVKFNMIFDLENDQNCMMEKGVKK